jgi:hypothetical protein
VWGFTFLTEMFIYIIFSKMERRYFLSRLSKVGKKYGVDDKEFPPGKNGKRKVLSPHHNQIANGRISKRRRKRSRKREL